jgi:phospholipid transport system substrate-binding protein
MSDLPMPRRRLLLAATACLAAAPSARAQGDPAVAFIQRRGEELLAIVNGNAPNPQKKQQVARLLTETVDVEGVGRFVVGRYWRTATPEEQREFQKLFQDMLLETISARFGELRGLKFQVTGPTRRDEESQGVGTVIERPGQPPAAVEWRIAGNGNAMKVIDLIAEGTSLRLTQRSEYTAVLQRNSGRFEALLGAMKRQLAQLQQG